MKSISLLPILMFSFSTALAQPAVQGKQVFTARCGGCHNVNKVVTGPALADVDKRHSMDWIVRFVRSSQTLIKSGDKDAVALFEKFNRIPMPDHADLSTEDISALVSYIRSETQTPDKAPFQKPDKLHPDYRPVPLRNVGFFATLLVLVGLLTGALLLFVKAKQLERSKEVAEA